jgi:adenosylhomocysteine nucleosidase
MTIAVVSALAEELAPLALRLAGRRPAATGHSLACQVGGRQARLMVTGDGAARAGENARRLVAEAAPEVLVGLGAAGGLTPDLSVGDTVVALQVLDERSGGIYRAPASLWLERGRRFAGARDATVVSACAVAVDRGAKARLAALVAPPAVVDLESAAWAAAATAAGVPFVIVRVVSDTWAEDLPLDFEALRDGRGSVDRLRVLGTALVRPRSWRALLTLRHRLARVGEELGDWGIEVLAA